MPPNKRCYVKVRGGRVGHNIGLSEVQYMNTIPGVAAIAVHGVVLQRQQNHLAQIGWCTLFYEPKKY